MRKLRRFYGLEELRQVYGHPYQPHLHAEHTQRLEYTAMVADALINNHGIQTAADLSAGDRTLVHRLGGEARFDRVVTHDLSDDGRDIFVALLELEPVDLFLLTETVEHLEAPWDLLEQVWWKTRWLLLTCPLTEPPGTGNWEHYWSFDLVDLRAMLEQAGYVDLEVDTLSGSNWTYTYQIWTARSTHA